MRRLLFVLLLLNLLVACSEKLPEGVLSRNKLPEILVQVHLLDANMNSMHIDSARGRLLADYQELFDYYQIDSNIFKQSIQYYSKRPEEFQAIYQEVTDKLQAMMDEDNAARAEIYRQQVIADSIKKVQYMDSLYQAAIDSLDFKRKRHLLRMPDSTQKVDARVPFHFIPYSTRFFQDQRLWRLNFDAYLRLDSSVRIEPFVRYPSADVNLRAPAVDPANIPPVQQEPKNVPTLKHQFIN